MTIQKYPRLTTDLLDDMKLKQHAIKVPLEKLKGIIESSLIYANTKSRRSFLSDISVQEEQNIENSYFKAGKELFSYFIKYCGDPASTAYACIGQNYLTVGKEQVRNRIIQMQRMNSGWRYQYIAKETGIESKRFISISDIGIAEADFVAIIPLEDNSNKLNIYVSVKNRTNTMGGQDWPKAIEALEAVASHDKNSDGPYICVFGIAMEKGERLIKKKNKTKLPYSNNTEIWKSDFFWPFFSNYSYEEIIKNVVDILIKNEEPDELDIEVPEGILEAFGDICKKYELVNEDGNFDDPYKLVDLFCGKLKLKKGITL